MPEITNKSMDDLEFNLQVAPSYWKATYSIEKKIIADIAGNKTLVTRFIVNHNELALGDILELVDEINGCLDARGFGYVIGEIPRMISIEKAMKA